MAANVAGFSRRRHPPARAAATAAQQKHRQNSPRSPRRAPSPASCGTTTPIYGSPLFRNRVPTATKDSGDEGTTTAAEGDERPQQQQFRGAQSPLTIYFKPNFAAIERGTQCQMENRSRIRPVQLFASSSSNPNVLKLNKSGLNAVLGHAAIANRKIAVISISGAYRKGKSFLLNFFLDYLYKLQYTQKNAKIEKARQMQEREESSETRSTRSKMWKRIKQKSIVFGRSTLEEEEENGGPQKCPPDPQPQELELEEWITDDDIVEGFLYKPGPKRSTTGIWVWAEPILIDVPNGERYAVLLMDTQGCIEQSSSPSSAASSPHIGASSPSSSNAASASYTGTSQNGGRGGQQMLLEHRDRDMGPSGTHLGILALSTMLSSVQCYCLGEGIPDDALALLSFFTDYGKLAHNEAKEFGKPFQRLAFLVRDFKLTDELIYGIEGGNRLLEKVLKPPEELHLGRKISNMYDPAPSRKVSTNPLAEVRRQLRTCFEHGISCYLLPHPGPKVADQNAGFRGHVKDIKQLFRDEVKRLVESLVAPNVIKPKMLNGRPVTVRKFIECVREYSRIFDSPEQPESRALLNANTQLACVEYALEAKLAYCRAMDRATRSSRMMAEKKLLEAHIKHGIKALNIYDRCPKIDSGDVRNTNLARLQESINHELERYQRLNEEKRVTTCASAMLACGDSPLFGLGLGGAASGAVAATVVTLQMGVVSAGIVAIPVSLSALFGIWVYVTLKPTVKQCLGLEKDN